MLLRRGSPILALLLACAACSGDDATADASGDTTAGTGETGAGDGDGDDTGGLTPPSSCTLRPVPIAKASFDAGAPALLTTPGTVAVSGELVGGTGPFEATWAGAKTQFFESPEISATPAGWDAQFEYSSASGWLDMCPADAPICAKSDRLSFSFTDTHTDEQAWLPLFAEASLCVDLNRSEPVCPAPVVLDSLTATADPDDPARIEFAVALQQPDLDCAGLDPEDGLVVRWTIDDGAEGFTGEGEAAVVTFASPNVEGRYFFGEVEAVCSKTYDAEGTPTTLELRASTQFFVDCQ